APGTMGQGCTPQRAAVKSVPGQSVGIMPRPGLRWLVFAAFAALLVFPQVCRTFEDAERYGYLADIMPSDWAATNVWLDSTDCALERGAWLALCASGKLVP